MNKNAIIGAVVVILLVIIGLVIANRGGDVEDAMNTSEPAELEDAAMEDLQDESEASLEGDMIDTSPVASPSVSSAAVNQGEVKEFAVAATNFKFDPASMRVKQGDTVRIVLTNNGSMPHDWKVDEFNAATKVIQPGQSDTVEFVAGEAGTFEYYCSVGQHRQLGMVGNLIVE